MQLIDRWFGRPPFPENPPSLSRHSWLPLWVRYPLPGPRRAARERWRQLQIGRLGEIDTTPATAQTGRVMTLVSGQPGRALDLAAYLKPWLRSVQQVGLRGTLLYAGPCDLASLRHQYPAIDLVPVSMGTRHYFLERHFAIRDYLKQITDEYVLITDGRDVAFRRDPFDILSDSCRRLCLGREEVVLGKGTHAMKSMQAVYHGSYHLDRLAVNPGIIGGSRGRVLELLERLTREIDTLDCRSLGSDMGVFNKVVHDHYSPEDMLTGEPLHSRFGHWEFNTPAAIIHK